MKNPLLSNFHIMATEYPQQSIQLPQYPQYPGSFFSPRLHFSMGDVLAKKQEQGLEQNNSGKGIALHVAKPGSIMGISYGSPCLLGVIHEHRAKSSP